jgi:hypothetical protein
MDYLLLTSSRTLQADNQRIALSGSELIHTGFIITLSPSDISSLGVLMISCDFSLVNGKGNDKMIEGDLSPPP